MTVFLTKKSPKSVNFWALFVQNSVHITQTIDYQQSSRRERDSNPWNAVRSTVFETAPIDHSGISPIQNPKNKSNSS